MAMTSAVAGATVGGGAKAGRPVHSRWRLAIVAALLGVAGGAWYWWQAGAQPGSRYVTAPAARGPIVKSISASGTVNPQMTIIVGSYVSGVIRDIRCDFNTRVTKGQLCAAIDPRPYQMMVEQAQAELATAKAQLVKDRAALDYARQTLARDAAMIRNGYVTQDAVDSAHSAVEAAAAQIDVDQAAIQQKQSALKAAQINLDYTRITSPVDGTVVSRNVTIGQTVAASFQTPTLFLIATDLTRMQVDTNVSESDVGSLKPGNRASFTVEAYPGRTFSGAVSQIRQAPQTVQNVVTYDVIVSVDNGDRALMPGMTATTRIVVDERRDVLRVPDQALRYTPAGSAAAANGARRVWVLHNGKPVAVEVSTGLDDDAYTEIVGGALAAGDAVIVGEQRAANAKDAALPVRFGL